MVEISWASRTRARVPHSEYDDVGCLLIEWRSHVDSKLSLTEQRDIQSLWRIRDGCPAKRVRTDRESKQKQAGLDEPRNCHHRQRSHCPQRRCFEFSVCRSTTTHSLFTYTFLLSALCTLLLLCICIMCIYGWVNTSFLPTFFVKQTLEVRLVVLLCFEERKWKRKGCGGRRGYWLMPYKIYRVTGYGDSTGCRGQICNFSLAGNP